MKLGDCPNIMFTPVVDPTTGGPPIGKTLFICNPYLYIYIRDLVMAGEALDAENSHDVDAETAMAKMMKEIMRYKPRSQRTEGERKLGPLEIRLEEHYPNPKNIKEEQSETSD